MEPLSCEQVKQMLEDLLQGRLSRTSVARVAAHLAVCDRCRDVWGTAIDRVASPDDARSTETRVAGLVHWDTVKRTYRSVLSNGGRLPDSLRSGMEGILSAGRQLLSTFPAMPHAEDLRRYIRRDPLFGLVSLGRADSPPVTDPFYYTGLRRTPVELRWRSDHQVQRYHVTLYPLDRPQEPIALYVACDESGWAECRLPGALDRGCIWQAVSLQGDSEDHNHRMAGKFWILPAEQARVLERLENECARIEEPLPRVLALSYAYRSLRLYGEALSTLSGVLVRSPAAPGAVPVREALASLYATILQDAMREDLRILDPVVSWVSDAGGEQLKLLCCVLLGNYGRFEFDGCSNCNECGLFT